MHNEAERTAQGRTAAAGGLTPLLSRKATEIAARLRRQSAGRRLAQALMAALGAGLLLVLVDRLVYLAPTVWLAASCGALVAAALVGGLAAWLLRPVSRFQGALAADEALGLKARLSSALEVAPLAGEPMVDGLLQDAEEHASQVRPAAVCPARWPLAAKLVPALAALLVGAFFVPRLDLFQRQAARNAEDARLTDNIRHSEENWQKLVKLARDAEKEKARAEALQKMWSELRRKADEMRRDVHNRPELKDELLRLANLEKDVNKAYDRIEARRRMLEKLGQYQQDNAGASQSPALKQMAEALKNGDQEAAQKAADRLRDELEKALGGPNGLTPEQRQDFGRQLKNLATAMNENPDLKQVAEKMNELADALQNLTDDQKEMLKEIKDLLSQMKSEFENLPDEADELAQLDDFQEMLNNLEELRDMLRQMAEMRQDAGGQPCPKCGKRSCGYCGGSRCDHTEHTNGQKCNCQSGGQGQPGGQGQGQPGPGGMGGRRIRMPGMGGGQSPGQGGKGGQDGQGGQSGQTGQGNPESNGPGMGGPGHGRGGVATEKEHPTSSRMADINNRFFHKNGHLFTRDMFGEGAKGDALKEYQQIVREAQAAEEAAGEDELPVPREYRQLIANYHDQILFADGPPAEEPTRALDGGGGGGKDGAGGNE